MRGNKSASFKGTAPPWGLSRGVARGTWHPCFYRHPTLSQCWEGAGPTTLLYPFWRWSSQVAACTFPRCVVAKAAEIRTVNVFGTLWSLTGNLGAHREPEGKSLKLFLLFADCRLLYSDYQVHTFLGHCLFCSVCFQHQISTSTAQALFLSPSLSPHALTLAAFCNPSQPAVRLQQPYM